MRSVETFVLFRKKSAVQQVLRAYALVLQTTYLLSAKGYPAYARGYLLYSPLVTAQQVV